MDAVFGGIEGGGTKFVCVVGTDPEHVLDEAVVPTTSPEETLRRVVEYFRTPRDGAQIRAMGVASFGPIDVDPGSPSYGFITTTPKQGWQHTDVVGRLRGALGVPVGWDTDVNGAALGEWRWGAGVGADPLVYLTIGTGIGGGAIVSGQPLHGLLHPEMGHLLVPSFDGDAFPGVCPFHGRCLEGVASGTALGARAGRPAQELAPDDPVWDLEAHYLAFGLLAIVEVLAPRRIVVGGGVAGVPGLLARVRHHLVRLNGSYIVHSALRDEVDRYVVAPGLGDRSGVMGALELAREAHESGR